MNEGWETVQNTQELQKLLSEIFSDEFMQTHSRFKNFAGFRYSSAVIVNWDAEVLVYPILLLDNFVKESTDFSSWDEMVRAATNQRFQNQAHDKSQP